VSTNLSFRTPEALKKKFRTRDIKGVANPGYIAKRDVERWYSLLSASMDEVRIEPADAVVMIYAVNWWLGIMDGHQLKSLPQQLRQQMGLDDFYRDAQLELAEQVERWPLAARAALWDAAERYDVLVHGNPGKTFGAALHLVGLHSYQLTPEELRLVEKVPAVESDQLPAAYMAAMKELDR
jgi:hypothetical protein